MKLHILVKSTILLLSFSVATAWAETPISSVPFFINASGSYYLTDSLTSAGVGIQISANDVTIDLRGHTLTGSATTDPGVYVSAGTNIVVKNGTIKNFSTGIQSHNSSGTYFGVFNVKAAGNTGLGIDLWGSNNQIEASTAFNNGGVGIYVGSGSSVLKSSAYNNASDGISAYDGATLVGNTTSGNGYNGIVTTRGATLSQNTSYNNVANGLLCSIGCTVVKNTTYGNQFSGVNPGARSVVKNNTADFNLNSGIYLTDVSYCLVDGNTATNNGVNINPCSTCVFGLNLAP